MIVVFLTGISISHADRYDPIVYRAQQALTDRGYDPGKPDGFWGRATERAVKYFQVDNDLPVTGKLDQETKLKLGILPAYKTISENSEKVEDRGIQIFEKKKSREKFIQELPYRRIFSVVIGINNYRSAPPLKWAVADAQAVYEKLIEYGIRKENVTALYNDAATYSSLIDLFSERLRNNTKKEDGVIIYFAGHGVTSKTTGGKEEGYLLASDSSMENIERTGISMDVLRILFDSIPAKHVLFIVDSCYSGFMLQRSVFIPQETKDYVNKITSLNCRQIITAGGKNEQATETAGHGLFTERFLSGLEGPADLNFDGIITGFELGTYLRQEVSMISENRQTPLFGNISGEGDFVFVRSDFDRNEIDLMKKKLAYFRLYETNYFSGIKSLRRQEWDDARKYFLQALSYKPDDFWVKDKIEYLDNLILYRESVEDRFGKVMNLIPGGVFIMGSEKDFPDEAPERTVNKASFYIDETEVTNAEYRRFLEDPSHGRFSHPDTPDEDSFKPLFWHLPEYSDPGKPVVGLSWFAAYAYANWAGKRLPTEEEWEKAARGTDGRRFVWGNEWQPDKDPCNWSSDKASLHLSPVGRFSIDVSPYKVKDLSGNVSEWILEPSNGYIENRVPLDGYGRPFKVARGGNYKTTSHMKLRAAYRSHRHPAKGYSTVGFRCARDPDDADKR